jgi:hypothetical protein
MLVKLGIEIFKMVVIEILFGISLIIENKKLSDVNFCKK